VPVAHGELTPSIDQFDVAIPSLLDTPEWNRLADSLSYVRSGTGNVVYPRSFMEKSHGFDERMYGWGAEDTDLYERAKHSIGIKHIRDLGCPKSIHIAHHDDHTKMSSLTERNRKILEVSTSFVRNERGWGEIPE